MLNTVYRKVLDDDHDDMRNSQKAAPPCWPTSSPSLHWFLWWLTWSTRDSVGHGWPKNPPSASEALSQKTNLLLQCIYNGRRCRTLLQTGWRSVLKSVEESHSSAHYHTFSLPSGQWLDDEDHRMRREIVEYSERFVSNCKTAMNNPEAQEQLERQHSKSESYWREAAERGRTQVGWRDVVDGLRSIKGREPT